MVQLWTVTQKGRRSTSSGGQRLQAAEFITAKCFAAPRPMSFSTCRLGHWPRPSKCINLLSTCTYLGAKNSREWLLLCSSIQFKSVHATGANDARQLVYKWTETSHTIRRGPGVCGEDGDESKDNEPISPPRWRVN